MKITSLISAILIFLLGFSASLHAENQALLIGINNYQGVMPNLQGIENDIRDMKQLAINNLGYQKSQVHVLQEEQATKQNILNAIRKHLIDKTKPNDRVLFYFSGHGYQITDKDGDEEDGQDETLVVYDVGYDEQTQQYTQMISDDELRELFDQIDDRHVTVIVDSCHSGTITRGLFKKTSEHLEKSLRRPKANSKNLTRSFSDITSSVEYRKHRNEPPFIADGRNRVVWSAVSSTQKALIDFTIPRTQSVFTRWFINGLVKKAADIDKNGKVSNAELLNYTQQKSAEHCRQDTQCALGLTPELQAPNQMYASLIPHSGFTAPTMPELTADDIPPTELADSLLPLRNDKTIHIDVEVNESATNEVKLGESLYTLIKSEKAGHLLLLDRDANGNLKQLYPNPSVDNNFIQANTDIYIPKDSTQFEVKATEVGNSQLIAIVTHDDINIDDITSRVKDLKPIVRHQDYLNELSQRIHGTWTGGNINRAVDYSIAKFAYTVRK